MRRLALLLAVASGACGGTQDGILEAHCQGPTDATCQRGCSVQVPNGSAFMIGNSNPGEESVIRFPLEAGTRTVTSSTVMTCAGVSTATAATTETVSIGAGQVITRTY